MDGLDPPEDHIDFIRENGMDGWCLTEHGHMNSFAQAWLHVERLNKAGANFKLVPGCEMYIHPDLDLWQLNYNRSKALKESAKTGSREDLIKIERELSGYKSPIRVKFDEDDDIVDIAIDDSETTITIENEEESKSNRFNNPLRRKHHLVVLPRTSEGLNRLFKLVSKGYMEGMYGKPRVDYKMLKEASAGGHLIASTACLAGPVSYSVFEVAQSSNVHSLTPDLLENKVFKEKVLANIGNTWDNLVWAFGEEFAFLELQFNRLPAQHLVNAAILEFADRNGLQNRLVVTADSHYPTPEKWRNREIYRGLGYGSLDPESLKLENLKCELYPKNAPQLWEEYESDKEVYQWYSKYEEQVRDAIERTHDIVHDLIEDVRPDTSVKLPRSFVPEGKTDYDYLVDLCVKGLSRKSLGDDPIYVDRLKKELKVIKDKDFQLYFITMARITQIARGSMLVGPARGSGGGSLVNYLLEITDVDPIEWDLSFERFLSPTRSDMPDVDSDFEDRDKLVKLLEKKFGKDMVIPIATYGMMKLSSLTKELCKLNGIEFDEVNAATRGMETIVKNKVAGKGDNKASMEVTFEMAYSNHEPFRKLMDKYPDVAEMIANLGKQFKSIGKHAGGVIISEDIPDRMPIIKSKQQLQSPWVESGSTKQLEPFGWIKFDLLGLETLKIIKRTIELIIEKETGKKAKFSDVRKWYEENLNPKVIDFNDAKVYDNVYRQGKFAGVFQFTNSGAQRLVRRAEPENLIDIATVTSIYRPGPLGGGVDKMYIKYKNNPDEIENMHPLVWKVLRPTYGLLIFQEQVMQLANIVGNVPLEECDDLRRAITKSSYKHLIPTMKSKFIDGCQSNGLELKEAEKLWENMVYFSGYGFNKSHAVAYAMVSYYCSWLLTYYYDEWICAYLESSSVTQEKLVEAFGNVKALGGEIAPLDARYATNRWVIMGDNRWMPSLSSCKGVGLTALQELEKYRPFDKIEDLLYDKNKIYRLSKLNKKALSSLIKVGAFDHFVGEGKEFNTTNQLYEVVINNNEKIKKTLKTKPLVGYEQFCELKALYSDMEEKSVKAVMQDQADILGSFDTSVLITDKVQSVFDANNIVPLDQIESSGFAWFVVNNANIKLTKTKKEYLLIDALDSNSGESRIYFWNYKKDKDKIPDKYSLCVAKIEKNEFGFKGWASNIKVIGT